MDHITPHILKHPVQGALRMGDHILVLHMVQYLIGIPGKIQFKQLIIRRHIGQIIEQVFISLINFTDQHHIAGAFSGPVYLTRSHLQPFLHYLIVEYHSGSVPFAEGTFLTRPAFLAQLLITKIPAL